MELLVSLFVIALIVVPLWRIFGRTGRSGAWALLAVVPMIGTAAAAMLWGFGPWPRQEGTNPDRVIHAGPPPQDPPPHAPPPHAPPPHGGGTDR